MKKLLLMLALIPGLATAEYLPSGCYVADYYRSDPCWAPLDNITQFYRRSSFTSTFQMDYYYGTAVSWIITEEDAYEQLHSYVTDENKKQARLIKKLRSACGSKCRKIK